MTTVMFEKIKKTCRYSALSMRMIWSYGKGKMLLWLLALVVSPVVNVVSTVVNGRMLGGIGELFEGGSLSMVLVWFVLLVLIKGGDRLFSELQSKVFYKMALAADESMMLYTMERTTRFKQIFFDSSASYDKLKDVIRDDFSVWSLNGCLNEILTSFITIVGVCVILMPYNALLTCLAMVAAVPLFALNLVGERYDEKSEGILNRGRHAEGYYTDLLNSSTAAKETRLFGISGKILEKWTSCKHKNQKLVNSVNRRKSAISVLIGATEVIYSGVIMYICALSTVRGEIGIGEFFIYTADFALLFTSVSDIMSVIRSALLTSSEYDKFMCFSELSADERGGRDDLPEGKLSIRFDNVSFGYDERDVIKNVSFEWNEGENIALIGRNGSGKSTLIKLLCGLYECREGHIYLGGVDVREYSQSALYKLFGVVYQDFCRYQLKLREIIAAQDMEAVHDEKRLYDAFYKSGGAELEHLMTCGMDTNLGREFESDGVELSGGQWQKLVIARNCFGGRRLKLFDEPASALDVMSEQRVAESLLSSDSNSVTNGTNLIISHRLSIGLLADKILYLENGRLVEQGSHDELMKQGGRYAEMFRLQAEKYT